MFLFDEIPQNSKIAIYGSGELGIGLKNELIEKRKDVYISFFIDTFSSGEIDGYKIFNIEEIKEKKSEFDLIIIASMANAEKIKNILIKNKFENFIFVDNKIFKKHIIKLLDILNIFEKQEDKQLYDRLADTMICKEPIENTVAKIKEIYTIAPERQYFDFINKDAINYVIDGGGYDCGSSIVFASEFKNIKKIYTFEPLYEQFVNNDYDKTIKQSNIIQIEKFGLSNKEETKFFYLSYAGSKIISESDLKNFDSSKICKIQTKNIDNFVKKNKIKKIDFIKMDIEGSELSALSGSVDTILNFRPQLAITIYHSKKDFMEIPLYLNELLKNKNYVFRLGHYSDCTWETVLYAIPKELYKQV
jgi:FkbM family methyltransferase